jgi:hypothetical protein
VNYDAGFTRVNRKSKYSFIYNFERKQSFKTIKRIHVMKFTTIIFSTLILVTACQKKDVRQKQTRTTCAVSDLADSLQKGIDTYYPFCGTTTDISGNSNNGSLTGGVFTADRFGNAGNAVQLTSDSSTVCSSHAYDSPQNFTISIWLKTTSMNMGRVVTFDESQCGHIDNWDRTIFIINGQVGFFVFSGTTQNIVGNPVISDNQWHHLAASLGSDGMKLYVDGNLVASNATVTTALAFTGYWRVGGFTNSTPVGSYDDFIIYNRVLSPSQIEKLSQDR